MESYSVQGAAKMGQRSGTRWHGHATPAEAGVASPLRSWFFGAHVSAAIAGAFQALGDIDGWRQDVQRLSVRENTLATLSVAVLVSVVLLDARRR